MYEGRRLICDEKLCRRCFLDDEFIPCTPMRFDTMTPLNYVIGHDFAILPLAARKIAYHSPTPLVSQFPLAA